MMRIPATALILGWALSIAPAASVADAGIDVDAGPSPVPVPVAVAPSEAQAKEGDAGPAEPVPEDLPTLAPDRAPTIELTVEPRQVSVGDLISWELKIRRRVGDRAHLSRSASFGDLEVQGKDASISDPDDDWVEETMTVNLIGFEPGRHEIPAQDITVVDIEGNLAKLKTDPVEVEVKSLIANEPEPDLKPDEGPGIDVYEEDYTLLYVLAVIGGIVVIALLTLLGRKLWSLRGPRPGPPPPPPRPAEEIALEKLEALRDSSYLDEGRHKIFHVILSEAFREYLGNRYRFHSLDRSTEELIAELRAIELERPLFNSILNLLNETDLVKFAKFIPGLEDSRKMLEEAFEVVDMTTPKVAPSAPEESGDEAREKKGDGDVG